MVGLKPKPLAAANFQKKLLERTVQLNNTRTELARQSKILVAKHNELRSLSARLLHAQDEERRRISRELHDSLGQGLALLCFDLSRMREAIDGPHPDLARSLGEKVDLAKKLSDEVRTISYLLHPPLLDDFGLFSAVRWYAEGFEKRAKITVALQLPEKAKRLTRDMETAIFRIIQECLTNIYRHANSRTASVRIAWGSSAALITVRDWGKGMSRQELHDINSRISTGLGLRGIEERVRLFGGRWGSEGSQARHFGRNLSAARVISGSITRVPVLTLYYCFS